MKELDMVGDFPTLNILLVKFILASLGLYKLYICSMIPCQFLNYFWSYNFYFHLKEVKLIKLAKISLFQNEQILVSL